VTIWKGDRINKGWAGHTVERHLGLALNSSRSPNFGSWELKVVPLQRLPDGSVKVKETMAITMIDPVEVSEKEFPNSHLFLKLQRMIVVARVFESRAESRSLCYSVTEFESRRSEPLSTSASRLRPYSKRNSHARLQSPQRLARIARPTAH
jgi:hypothetical protein